MNNVCKWGARRYLDGPISHRIREIDDVTTLNVTCALNGTTLMHYVAGLGMDKGVHMLLEAGIDTEKKDRRGQTPLHHAAEGS